MIKADSVHSTPPTNTSASNPPDGSSSPQETLYRRTDISPETFFQALGRLRQEAQDEVERLIRFLDETEPDPDLEPYLAGFSRVTDDREGGESEDEGADGADDREGDELQHGGEAAYEDDEPSLGWTDEEAASGRTYAGAMGETADLEQGGAPRAPQNRTAAPRAPSPQESADELLMRWRLARAAGIPAANRLDQEDRS